MENIDSYSVLLERGDISSISNHIHTFREKEVEQILNSEIDKLFNSLNVSFASNDTSRKKIIRDNPKVHGDEDDEEEDYSDLHSSGTNSSNFHKGVDIHSRLKNMDNDNMMDVEDNIDSSNRLERLSIMLRAFFTSELYAPYACLRAIEMVHLNYSKNTSNKNNQRLFDHEISKLLVELQIGIRRCCEFWVMKNSKKLSSDTDSAHDYSNLESLLKIIYQPFLSTNKSSDNSNNNTEDIYHSIISVFDLSSILFLSLPIESSRGLLRSFLQHNLINPWYIDEFLHSILDSHEIFDTADWEMLAKLTFSNIKKSSSIQLRKRNRKLIKDLLLILEIAKPTAIVKKDKWFNILRFIMFHIFNSQENENDIQFIFSSFQSRQGKVLREIILTEYLKHRQIKASKYFDHESSDEAPLPFAIHDLVFISVIVNSSLSLQSHNSDSFQRTFHSLGGKSDTLSYLSLFYLVLLIISLEHEDNNPSSSSSSSDSLEPVQILGNHQHTANIVIILQRLIKDHRNPMTDIVVVNLCFALILNPSPIVSLNSLPTGYHIQKIYSRSVQPYDYTSHVTEIRTALQQCAKNTLLFALGSIRRCRDIIIDEVFSLLYSCSFIHEESDTKAIGAASASKTNQLQNKDTASVMIRSKRNQANSNPYESKLSVLDNYISNNISYGAGGYYQLGQIISILDLLLIHHPDAIADKKDKIMNWLQRIHHLPTYYANKIVAALAPLCQTPGNFLDSFLILVRKYLHSRTGNCRVIAVNAICMLLRKFQTTKDVELVEMLIGSFDSPLPILIEIYESLLNMLRELTKYDNDFFSNFLVPLEKALMQRAKLYFQQSSISSNNGRCILLIKLFDDTPNIVSNKTDQNPELCDSLPHLMQCLMDIYILAKPFRDESSSQAEVVDMFEQLVENMSSPQSLVALLTNDFSDVQNDIENSSGLVYGNHYQSRISADIDELMKKVLLKISVEHDKQKTLIEQARNLKIMVRDAEKSRDLLRRCASERLNVGLRLHVIRPLCEVAMNWLFIKDNLSIELRNEKILLISSLRSSLDFLSAKYEPPYTSLYINSSNSKRASEKLTSNKNNFWNIDDCTTIYSQSDQYYPPLLKIDVVISALNNLDSLPNGSIGFFSSILARYTSSIHGEAKNNTDDLLRILIFSLAAIIDSNRRRDVGIQLQSNLEVFFKQFNDAVADRNQKRSGIDYKNTIEIILNTKSITGSLFDLFEKCLNILGGNFSQVKLGKSILDSLVQSSKESSTVVLSRMQSILKELSDNNNQIASKNSSESIETPVLNLQFCQTPLAAIIVCILHTLLSQSDFAIKDIFRSKQLNYIGSYMDVSLIIEAKSSEHADSNEYTQESNLCFEYLQKSLSKALRQRSWDADDFQKIFKLFFGIEVLFFISGSIDINSVCIEIISQVKKCFTKSLQQDDNLLDLENEHSKGKRALIKDICVSDAKRAETCLLEVIGFYSQCIVKGIVRFGAGEGYFKEFIISISQIIERTFLENATISIRLTLCRILRVFFSSASKKLRYISRTSITGDFNKLSKMVNDVFDEIAECRAKNRTPNQDIQETIENPLERSQLYLQKTLGEFMMLLLIVPRIKDWIHEEHKAATRLSSTCQQLENIINVYLRKLEDVFHRVGNKAKQMMAKKKPIPSAGSFEETTQENDNSTTQHTNQLDGSDDENDDDDIDENKQVIDSETLKPAPLTSIDYWIEILEAWKYCTIQSINFMKANQTSSSEVEESFSQWIFAKDGGTGKKSKSRNKSRKRRLRSDNPYIDAALQEDLNDDSNDDEGEEDDYYDDLEDFIVC